MTPSSILLIKLRHHGDVLLTTPVAQILKAHFPNCSVDLLVYEGTEALLEGNPDIAHVWRLDRQQRGWRKWWHQGSLLKKMAAQKYDWVLHLSDQMQGALFAKILAHKESVGIDYPKRRHFWWRGCFTRLAPLFASNTHHTVEQNLMPLRTLGLNFSSEEATGRLVISEKERFAVQNLLTPFFERIPIQPATNNQQLTTLFRLSGRNIPYLVVHPASRWFLKCWEDDRFAEVIQYFADQGWPVIITSSPEEQEMQLVEAILQKTTSPRIFSLAGQLTLKQLAALLEGARLFVGVDSVPMHMAAALQKDTVALFGPSKVKEWHPWKTCYRLIDARDYGPLIDPDAVDTSTTERYLKNIPVAPVIAAIEELLGKNQ